MTRELSIAEKEQAAAIERLMKKWAEDDDSFYEWSRKQLDIFKADLAANLQGRLAGLKEDDELIRACPGPFGKVDYYPATVKEVDTKKDTVRVEFLADVRRSGEYSISNGVSVAKPDFGWLAPFDKDIELSSVSPIPALKGD